MKFYSENALRRGSPHLTFIHVSCVILSTLGRCTIFYCMNTPRTADLFSEKPTLRQRLASSVVTRKCPWEESCGRRDRKQDPEQGEVQSSVQTQGLPQPASQRAQKLKWPFFAVLRGCGLPQERQPGASRLSAAKAIL